MSPGEGWVSASWIESGAARATHRSVASVTPCARTAASTPSAIRSPSRLISRSMAKATGTSRIAMLEARPAILMSRSGAWPVPLLMSCSRPEVVPCANAAIPISNATASTPTRSRIRSDGRCTRAASSGSSPSTSSTCAVSGDPVTARASCPPVFRPSSGASGRDEASEVPSVSSGSAPCCFIVSSWSRITGHRPHDGGMPHRHAGASGCTCGGGQSARRAASGRGKRSGVRASLCRWGGAGWDG